MRIIQNVYKDKGFALINVILISAIITVILFGSYKIINSNIRRLNLVRKEISIYGSNKEEELLCHINDIIYDNKELYKKLIEDKKIVTINSDCRLVYKENIDKVEAIFYQEGIPYIKVYKYKYNEGRLSLFYNIER